MGGVHHAEPQIGYRSLNKESFHESGIRPSCLEAEQNTFKNPSDNTTSPPSKGIHHSVDIHASKRLRLLLCCLGRVWPLTPPQEMGDRPTDCLFPRRSRWPRSYIPLKSFGRKIPSRPERGRSGRRRSIPRSCRPSENSAGPPPPDRTGQTSRIHRTPWTHPPSRGSRTYRRRASDLCFLPGTSIPGRTVSRSTRNGKASCGSSWRIPGQGTLKRARTTQRCNMRTTHNAKIMAIWHTPYSPNLHQSRV